MAFAKKLHGVDAFRRQMQIEKAEAERSYQSMMANQQWNQGNVNSGLWNQGNVSSGLGGMIGSQSWPTTTVGGVFGANGEMFPAGQFFARELEIQRAHEQALAVMEEPKPAMEMIHREAVRIPDNLDSPAAELATQAADVLGYSVLRKHMHLPGALSRTLAKLEIEVLNEKDVAKYKAQMQAHMRTARKDRMADPQWMTTNLRYYGLPVPEFVLSKCVEIKKELPDAEFVVEHLRNDPFMAAVFDGEKLYIDVWDEPKFEGSM